MPVTHGKKRFLPSFNSDQDVDVEQPEADDYRVTDEVSIN